MTIIELARLTEEEARELIEKIRWPDGPVCPHCEAFNNAVRLEGKATRPGVYKCRSCNKQFTVTVNTVMHRSKVPLVKWLMAFHLMCSSKKGMSALQLQRELGLGNYQTAWHLAHRIRYAMGHAHNARHDGHRHGFGHPGHSARQTLSVARTAVTWSDRSGDGRRHVASRVERAV